MLTIGEALDAVMRESRVLPPVECPVDESLRCVLAEDVAADADSPPFDKALVDGYAVRAVDVDATEQSLTVGELITAGRMPSRALGRREAAVIMTGAPIPPGCDAVVMQERTRSSDGRVWIEQVPVVSGQNLLRRGAEMRAGDVVVKRGSVLSPARLGVMASVGRSSVIVVPAPRVAIVPTGDELVEPDVKPGPGQIRNSNAVMLGALSREAAAVAETLPIAPDEPARLKEILARGLMADVMLVTGGVSAGQRDLVPDALEALGVRRVFHKVRLKPGKPLWFGVGQPRGDRPGALVFGLPGNPVSGLVGFLLFVRPALAQLAGRSESSPHLREATLSGEFAHRGDRATYHPARLVSESSDPGGTPSIATLSWAGSADLRTAASADGFAVFAAGDRDYSSGEIVGFLPMR
jgi:molybdopterin molybdotransferase